MLARARWFLLLLLPGLAFAHPDHEVTATFARGLLHPITGLDHILAMLAVGVWAAYLGRTAAFALPVMFPMGMLAGAVLAMLGVALPALEAVIAVSVVALGALIALRIKFNVAAAALLVAAFAVFHGYAHASEAPGGIQVTYAIGFVAATFVLHVVGLLLGSQLQKRAPATIPATGALISIAGAVLLCVG